uniref:Uncharacterized protein n=1 Tax=Moschus moschiferus TaxID=68415 RepID=A0A8C6CGC5_MOSMO
ILCLLVGAFNPFTCKVIIDKYDPVAIFSIALGSSLYTLSVAGLVIFCLSVKLLISPSYLNEILAGYSNLGCRLLSFITLISVERSAVILMGIPLCVICSFSLAAFNICSLCLIFVNLINMCLGVFRLGFILLGTLWVSWTWVIISFPILGKFSSIISSSILSWSFFLSSSGIPMIRMLGFPISSSFVCVGGHLSCSFTCWVFLCLFILLILLCLGWPFRLLAVCGVLFIM